MRFGVIANMGRPDAEAVVRRIFEWARQKEVSLSLCQRVTDEVETEFPSLPRRVVAQNSDVIVSLGGDGTLLATARAVGRLGRPILGINLGSLGFLTQLRPTAVEDTLTAVLEGKYSIEKRMVAEVKVEKGPELDHPFALNDIVIDRGAVSRIIHMDLFSNNYFICSYAADGLIIATPTGSTAYALAVGGPIINPLLDAFIAVPISAFSLTTRPIIFSDKDVLKVMVKSTHSNPVLTIDGQISCSLPKESSFTVRKADYCINFIVFRENSFYDVLRSKLHWGRLPESEPGRELKSD
jgi:NAD+ kinase